MRGLLKRFIIDSISLYLISQATTGLNFKEGYYTLVLTAFALMLTTLVVKPVISLLLLPLNLVTLGLFKWVTYAITFYLVTLVVPGFSLGEFVFKGISSYWFVVPPLHLNGILAFLAFAFVISFVSSVLHWVFK
jgi:putative membrane protein